LSTRKEILQLLKLLTRNDIEQDKKNKLIFEYLTQFEDPETHLLFASSDP